MALVNGSEAGESESAPPPKPAPARPPLTDAEEEAWKNRVEPVVRRIANKLRGNRQRADFKDLLQDGCEIGIVAMREYNREIGTLEQFVGDRVQNRLIDRARHEGVRVKHHCPLILPEHERLTWDGPCRLEREEQEGSESKAVAAAVQRLRHFLSPREIDLLHLRGSMKDSEIAQRWGCTRRWVIEVRKDALKALQREAELGGAPKSKILAALLRDGRKANAEQLLCQVEKNPKILLHTC